MNVRTYYYNTAPRGVQSRDDKVVEEEIKMKQQKLGKAEDENLPQWLRLEIAGRVLDTYM